LITGWFYWQKEKRRLWYRIFPKAFTNKKSYVNL